MSAKNKWKNFVLAVCCVCIGLLGSCTDTAGTASSGSVPPESAPASSEPAPPQEQVLSGTVYEAANSTIVIEDDHGTLYQFPKKPEILDAPEGIMLGAAAAVTYTGRIGEDGSTDQAEILRIEIAPPPGVFDSFLPEARKMAADLTMEEKLAQMILSATFQSNGDPVAQAERDQPGGYVLFRKDFENLTAEQIQEKLAAMQAVSKIPMLMAVDEEGGSVVRISSSPLLRAERFGAPGDLCREGLEAVCADAEEKADLMLSLGCNVLLAPVADVSEDPADYIYDRTAGLPAEGTADYVTTVIKAVQGKKCGTVMKHFPGYGNNVNTHSAVSVDERSLESFRESDFLPFEAGIQAGGGGVLVSHNIVVSMDPDLPASLSPAVNDILRNDLGFTGVIMTDDLGMDAIRLYTGEEDPAVLAVQAGNDMLISQDFTGTYATLLEAWKAGKFDEEEITESVERILCWKISLGLTEGGAH